ncbi:MAG TPA: helix-turn-helix domain-containing protein [Candidatus Acidoferrales bacterium]|nr:helix-turn-helix domain-containing protein [Candidatus Acidoferrales bacterium]
MRSEEKEGFQKEDIQVLVDLGLTSLQARAYLALSSLGTAPMRSIAKLSDIARQDIYRLMSNLQELGLAEKIIATPSMYKATPLKEGIAVLLRHKSQEYDQLQAKIKDIVSNFQTPQLKALLPIEDSNFFIISEKKLLYRTLDEKNTTVQKSLLVAGTWESCRGVLFNSELHNFRQALDRGVRIKWITEEHDEDLSTLKPLQVLLENPLFEIRYFKPPIPLQTAIYDEKEVVMCIAVLPDPDVTSIWSNNPMFLRVATNYWEEVWNGSIKDSSKVAANKVNRKLATQP